MIAEAYIGALQVHGAGTIALTGFTIGSPDPRPVVDVRPEDHGTVDGTRWYGPRVIDVAGRIVGTDHEAMWAALDDLKGALALGSDVTLRFRRTGRSALERVTGRVSGAVDVPLVPELGAAPMLRFGFALEAPDPRMYSDTESTGSYDPTDTGAGGLGFPLTFPIVFSGGTGTVSDEFTYPDGNLNGNGDWVESVWGASGARAPQVASGTVIRNSLSGGSDLATDRGPGRVTWALAAPPNVVDGSEFYALSGVDQSMLAVYLNRSGVEGLRLGQYLSGGSFLTLAGPFPTTFAAGDTITLEYDGDSAALSYNGVELGSAAHAVGRDTGRLGFWLGEAGTALESVLYEPAGSDAAALQVENAGTITTPALITITGPVTNPIVDNDTAGLSIYTRDLELGAGETVTLDTRTRAVLLGGTTSRPDLIDVARTDWWGLLPGVNQVRLRGGDMSAGSTELAVTYRSARI